MAGKMQVPDGWEAVRLGEVATLQRDVDLPIQDRVPGSVPVYGSNGILGTHVQTLHPGPGVITGRSGSIGVVYFLTGPYWPLNTTLYVRDFHGNSERFIYYLLSQLKLERFAASTGVPSLNRNFVHPEPVPLPPLPEQRAIAAVLDSIDEAIESTEAVVAATERLRDALLHELLTRGVPGWHSEWKEAPGIGMVPADWEVVRLRDVAEVNRDQWDPAEGSSILYLDLTAVAAPGRLSPPNELAAEDAPSRARRRVQAGDVLISTVRPYLRGFARLLEAPHNLIASTGFAVLTPLPKVDGSLIYHHVMAPPFVRHLEASMTGQAYPAVRPSDVTSYSFALPPLPEQHAIAAVLDGVDDAIKRAHEERSGLQSLKASAADALLSGRVRVPH